jgi:hypothetical protein
VVVVQLSFAVVCAVACALPSSAPAKVGTCLLLLETAVNANDPSSMLQKSVSGVWGYAIS